MIYFEKIGVVNFVFLLATRKQAFYYEMSFVLKLMRRIFPRSFARVNIYKKLYIHGDVLIATNVEKTAYLNAKKYIDDMQHKTFFLESDGLFGIDFLTVFKMHIFSNELCQRYEFFELAMRYAAEHPGEKHFFYLSSPFANIYYGRLKEFGKIYVRWDFPTIRFICTVVLSPLLLWGYWKIKGQKNSLSFEDKILFNADDIRNYKVFDELFGNKNVRTQYLVTTQHLKSFTVEELRKLEIIHLKLCRADYYYLRKYVFRYVCICLKCYREVGLYGSSMIKLFFLIIQGREETPKGKRNVFITYEHLYTQRAVRNEFIKLEGSKSVFFAVIHYPFSQYHYFEVYHNYDFLCSSGKQLEDLYLKKMAKTRTFLPTGSYDIHHSLIKDIYYRERVAKLKAFKADSIAITILSTGITAETYSNEVRIMKLAEKLGRQQGIKVFIRTKSRTKSSFLDKEDVDFYKSFITNKKSMQLTVMGEYELFDFLEVTDLFVTAISSSGCEIAVAGGQVMFVDFMKTPDRYFFWEVLGDVTLSEENAFEMIMQWVNDGKGGRIRCHRKKAMDRLKDYVGYTFPDFKTYKVNLLKQLRENVSPLF